MPTDAASNMAAAVRRAGRGVVAASLMAIPGRIGRAVSKEALLFEKRSKNFDALAYALSKVYANNKQEFFRSLLQKRTPFLPRWCRATQCQPSHTHECVNCPSNQAVTSLGLARRIGWPARAETGMRCNAAAAPATVNGSTQPAPITIAASRREGGAGGSQESPAIRTVSQETGPDRDGTRVPDGELRGNGITTRRRAIALLSGHATEPRFRRGRLAE